MGLMDKLRQGVVEVAEEAEKAARIGRLSTEVIGFKEQKGRILREVGQRVIAVYAEGGRTDPDFSAEWEKIQELEAEIAQREEKIEATKTGT
ncbi:MAG: hypothetical protein B6I34_11510 [Anaerolineaceae bacterium 4572_32.1]|nr:MAG: hypothetical protein B6I34_11510 [Anaerolineaceae bacterium 4572_32.1]